MIAATMEWLADTVLWTGLLIALVLLVRRPVARACGPQIAYALWALPLARLVLPPVVLPAPAAPQPLVMLPSGTGEGLAPVMLAPALVVQPVPAPFPWTALLVVAWAAGALAFLVLRTVTYRRMRRRLLAEATVLARIGRVRLVETPAVVSPVAFGVLDQVIALPVDFAQQADRQARDLAIAHELSHHRAHDLLANMAAQVLLALHWCNPVAWLGWRAMRQDQEAACDARVMAGCGRAERACYAALIVGFSASQSGRMMTLATPMAGPILGEGPLLQRLRCLTRGDASPGGRIAGRLLVGVGALALPLTASISYAASQDAVDAAPLPPAAPAAPAAEAAAIPQPMAPIDPDAPHPAEDAAMAGQPIVVNGDSDADAWAAFGARMEAFGRRMGAFAGGGEPDEAAIERDAEAFAAEMEQQFAPGGAMHAIVQRQTEAALRMAAAATACAEQAGAGTGAVACADADATPHALAAADMEARIEAHANRAAARALLGARAAIAANPAMAAEERAEVLRELDSEIAELGRE